MYRIGIDLGGTSFTVGIVDEAYNIIYKVNKPTLAHRSGEEIIKDMAETCENILKDNAIDKESIKCIGLGVPGIVDPPNGRVVIASNINMSDTPLRSIMQNYINLPVYMENDANAAALGEHFAGSAQGCKNSVTVTLGTGVGAGIIIDSKVYSGPFFGAGELGHMIIKSDGELCACGRQGHFEAYSSATALIRDTKKAAIENPKSSINEAVFGILDDITPKTAFDCAQAGDKAAKDVIDNYIYYLSVGLTNIVHIFQPEIIVIGGGISNQGASLIKLIEKTIEPLIYGDIVTKFKTSSLGSSAAIIGASLATAT